jgi:hypothetical protein
MTSTGDVLTHLAARNRRLRRWNLRRIGHVVVLMTLVAPSVQAQGDEPVPIIAQPVRSLFPGATNADITPDNVDQNICKTGWSTKNIRPPATYTTALKREQMKSLNYAVPNPLPTIPTKSGNSTRLDVTKCVEQSANPACYEEDHLISLELGGDPRSPDNLWPEPWFGAWNAHIKDTLENKLHTMVCSGDIGLREAQQAISTDWVAAYRKYVGKAVLTVH